MTMFHSLKDLSGKNLSAKYFALYSLGELGVIDKSYQAKILPCLYDNCTSDEGTRQVISECLGKLALTSPIEITASFQENIKSTSANVRSVVLNGVKFSIVEKPHDVDKVLQPVIGAFLDCLKDSDLNVRRNAILVFDSLVRYKPLFVKEQLSLHFIEILGETEKKSHLVRTIDLGSFKHEVDEGVENRKSAFELINHLLDAGFELGNLSNFVSNQLASGLKDTNDIKLLSYSCMIKLASVPSGVESLRAGIDKLVPGFTSTIAKPVEVPDPKKVDPKKVDSKKEEEKKPVESGLPEEIIRGGLAAIAALALIPGITNPKFEELLQNVNKRVELKEKYTVAASQEGKRDLRSSKQ